MLAAPAPPAVVVLRVDNVLQLVRGGHVRTIEAFGHARSGAQTTEGRLFQVSGRTGLLLVQHARPRPDELVFLRLPALRIVRRLALPPAITFRAFAIDRTRGAAVVVGNRQRDHDVVALRVTLATARVGPARTLRRSEKGAFRVFSAAVSADGTFAVVSYHGTNTSGADVFRLPGWNGCRSALLGGCLGEVHGQVVVAGDTIYATTGTPPAVAVYRGLRRVARVPLAPQAHVTALAVAPRGAFAWVPGSCDAPGGVWRVDLAHGRATWYYRGLLTPEGAMLPCGSTIDLSADGWWAATTETARPVPNSAAGAVWVFSTRTRVRARIPIEVSPVAAAFLPS